jgi:amino acid permease
MGYAGTAGMVWGWIIAMIFIQCIAMSMAELCSAMPTRYVILTCFEPLPAYIDL